MSNRQDDLFHLIGKLEATLESVKERKISCDKCFDDIKKDIQGVINDLVIHKIEILTKIENHEANDKQIKKNIYKYIYISLGIGVISIITCITIAKDNTVIIDFLSKIFSIFL